MSILSSLGMNHKQTFVDSRRALPITVAAEVSTLFIDGVTLVYVEQLAAARTAEQSAKALKRAACSIPRESSTILCLPVSAFAQKSLARVSGSAACCTAAASKASLLTTTAETLILSSFFT